MAKTKNTKPAKVAEKIDNADAAFLEGVGNAVVKKKRTRPEQQVHTEPGENTKYLNHNLQVMRLPKIDTNNAELVQERIERYFEICAENDMKPNIPGLALSLGVDRTTLWRWVNGQLSKPEDVRNTIKNAYQIINSMMEDWMQNGKINPVAGIFLMKNNMGYADKQEVVVTPNQPLGNEMSSDDLQQKYIDDVVFEVEDPGKE